MRFLIICVSTVAFAVSAADAVAQNAAASRPNVLFIAVDDLRPELEETTPSRVAGCPAAGLRLRTCSHGPSNPSNAVSTVGTIAVQFSFAIITAGSCQPAPP